MRTLCRALLFAIFAAFGAACSDEADAPSNGGSGTIWEPTVESDRACRSPPPDPGDDPCLACGLERCCDMSHGSCLQCPYIRCVQECFERAMAPDPAVGSWPVVSACHDECTSHEPDHYQPLHIGGWTYNSDPGPSDLLCLLGIDREWPLGVDGGSDDDAGPPGPARQLETNCVSACFPSWK